MSNEEARYRLRPAEGFLGEARHNLQHQLWRSCVDNSHLTAENAAKAVLGLLGPMGSAHDPGAALLEALDKQRFTEEIEDPVRRIAQCARTLGLQVHLQSDYGDEAVQRTPWESPIGPAPRRRSRLPKRRWRSRSRSSKEGGAHEAVA